MLPLHAGWRLIRERTMTDIPPPPPATPIIVFFLAALAGAVLTALGYVVQRAVWPDHDPVSLLLQLWH